MKHGIPAVILFGIPEKKDAKASGAYAADGIVHEFVDLAERFPEPFATHFGAVSRASFAEACEAAGLHYIGPHPNAIRLMGDKARARRAMKKAGLPMLPGSDGPVDSEEKAAKVAWDIGYPVIVKATAGGGGRGGGQGKRAGGIAGARRVYRRLARGARTGGARARDGDSADRSRRHGSANGRTHRRRSIAHGPLRGFGWRGVRCGGGRCGDPAHGAGRKS